MRDPLYTGGLTRRSLMFDVAVAVLFGLLAMSLHFAQSIPAGIAAALVTVALAVRRLAPTLMSVLALASAVIQVATDQIAVLASLAYFPIFATLGGHPDQQVRRSSLVVAVVGSLVAGWEFPHAYGVEPSLLSHVFTMFVGFCAAAVVVIGGWAFGFIRYQRRTVAQAQVAETIAQLERRRLLDLYDEQRERTRLARDMHDVVAHSLTIVVAQAEGARYSIDAAPEVARQALTVIADTARESLGEVRGLLAQLNNDDAAAASRADRETLYQRMRTAGMTIETHEVGDEEISEPAIGRMAQRVLTEALTNALKYGDLTTPVTVDIDWTNGCHLTVRNALTDTPLSPGGAGRGIIGMAERAALVGGTVRSRAVERSWLVELNVPAPCEVESKGISR
ncbi:sensor histidine kinase [Gordonia aichiensis]